jgi:exodeoxyribonuclease VII large subunit
MEEPIIPVLSVTDFNSTVNEVLRKMRVWVQGEVSGYKVSQNKWVSFDIKDKGSRLNCFTTVYTLDIALEDGMEVKVLGTPSVYVPYGKYSFSVQRVEPVGEGALRRAFELTKKKLEEEGLFDPARKKLTPRFPRTIGIVTSPEAAAYTDFLRILNNRWRGVEVVLRPSVVQGNDAPAQIVDALEWFNKYYPVDVIVLTRGGGSLEDLQAFNSEMVCRAVYASRIPIICGVGHERDITLAELVADIRASTPSNAAELAVPDRKEIAWQLGQFEKTMAQVVMGHVSQLKWGFRELLGRMERPIRAQFEQFQQREHQLHSAFQSFQSRTRQYGEAAVSMGQRLDSCYDRLLLSHHRIIDQAQQLLSSYNPKQVLQRGYAIARAGNGKIIRQLSQVKVGESVQIEVEDGAFTSQVTTKGKRIIQNGSLF